MGRHTASGARSDRGGGTNQLHELLADAWVQLARERLVEFLGADQFLDIGEIAEPVGCGHAGGELQFDQPRQLEDANSLDFAWVVTQLEAEGVMNRRHWSPRKIAPRFQSPDEALVRCQVAFERVLLWHDLGRHSHHRVRTHGDGFVGSCGGGDDRRTGSGLG